MDIKSIEKKELKKFEADNGTCLAFLGCDISTPEFVNGFLEGFAEHLADSGATVGGKKTAEDLFIEVRSYQNKASRPARTDLIYVLKDEAINMGRLAVVRMGMGAQLKWFDDYLDNGLHNR